MFDLDSIDVAASCEAGHEFQLNHPLTLEPLPVFVTVRGMESDRVTRHLQERMRSDAQRLTQARRRGQAAPELTPEESEARAVELAAVCTIGWRGVTSGGAELAFSLESARAVYRRHAWMGLQVIEQARDLGNFAPKPNASLSSSAGISSS